MLSSSPACVKRVCFTTETDSFTEGCGSLCRLPLRVHTWPATSYSDYDLSPALLFECFILARSYHILPLARCFVKLHVLKKMLNSC